MKNEESKTRDLRDYNRALVLKHPRRDKRQQKIKN